MLCGRKVVNTDASYVDVISGVEIIPISCSVRNSVEIVITYLMLRHNFFCQVNNVMPRKKLSRREVQRVSILWESEKVHGQLSHLIQ